MMKTGWVSDWVCYFSPWVSSAMEAATETKFGTNVAWGWGWCQNFEYMHSAEKARDGTLDDKKIWCALLWRHSVTSPNFSLQSSVTTSHVTCSDNDWKWTLPWNKCVTVMSQVCAADYCNCLIDVELMQQCQEQASAIQQRQQQRQRQQQHLDNPDVARYCMLDNHQQVNWS